MRLSVDATFVCKVESSNGAVVFQYKKVDRFTALTLPQRTVSLAPATPGMDGSREGCSGDAAGPWR